MQQRKSIFMEVVKVFDVDGQNKGVLLEDVRSTSGSGKLHYVARSNDISNATEGSFIELPCRMHGSALRIPSFLELAWKGPIEGCSRQIRSSYLTHLYNGPLHVSRGIRAEEKNFDSKAVFAHPMLKLLEATHDLLNEEKLHTLLSATGYQYHRKAVYTRFHHDESGRAYSTPRRLRYDPLTNTVTVEFGMGVRPSTDDEESVFDGIDVGIVVRKVFQNEGWTSLRDMVRNDPKLKSFVDLCRENRYIVPEAPEHPACLQKQ